jgi:hypothetical protein
MNNRRQFIGTSAATIALALPAAKVLSAARSPALDSRSLPLDAVIFDSRTNAGLSFGAEARRLGAPTKSIGEQSGDRWFEELQAVWKQQPGAVAGMTAFNAMFVVSMFAQDHGLRLIYRAHHRRAQDGSYTHESFGPRALLSQQLAFSGTVSRWAQNAARLLVSWPESGVVIGRARSTIADANRRQLKADAMVSWLMAPVVGAAAPLRQTASTQYGGAS